MVVPMYEDSPRDIQHNEENPKNWDKNRFIPQSSLLLDRYTFPSDV